MSIFDEAHYGVKKRPHFICLYGVGGIGKTTFGFEAPKPFFIGTDDGCGTFHTASWMPKTWQDVLRAVDDLLNGKHEFETAVFDTVNGLEALLWAHLCQVSKCGSIDEVDGGFGKGYLKATAQFVALCNTLKRLREKMNVILLGHAKIKPTEDPYHNEKYDRYSLKMDWQAGAVIHEAVDCTLFANYLIETSKGKHATKAKATGEGERVMFTQERPAFIAKNRFDLPFQMPLSWHEFAARAQKMVTAASVDDMERIFAGIEKEALAYLIEIKWLQEGQKLTDLMATKRKNILSREDKFIAAVKNFASEEQAPTPTTEENE